MHPMAAAMSPASVAPDQSEAADTARKIARAREEILDLAKRFAEGRLKKRQFRLAELAAEAWSFGQN